LSDRFFFRQLKLGPMDNFVYLFGDQGAKLCGVADPAWNPSGILNAVSEGGMALGGIFLTHHHPDHVNAVSALLGERPVPVYVHESDAVGLPFDPERVRRVRDGDSAEVGGLKIRFLHTPGHTEGSQCLLADGKLMTGDTLFIGECGRVDLAGSDPDKLFHSLRRIWELAETEGDITVYPGHDYGPRPCAPLSEERETNRYIQASRKLDLKDFRRVVL